MKIGSSANESHLQAYLIEGLVRWNADRAADWNNDKTSSSLRTFDVETQSELNSLKEDLFGAPHDPSYCAPSSYTNELFGVDYLRAERNEGTLSTVDLEILEKKMDDEISRNDEPEPENSPAQADLEELEVDDFSFGAFIAPDGDDSEDSGAEEEEMRLSYLKNTTDSRGIAGWGEIDELASFLVESETGLAMEAVEAEEVVRLYNKLSDFDKTPLQFEFTAKPSTGRFARNKERSGGHIGVTAMKRAFVTAGVSSFPPSKSRLVEAIFIHLGIKITSHTRATRNENYISRATRIINQYTVIQKRVMQCPIIIEKTTIQLFSVNETHYVGW